MKNNPIPQAASSSQVLFRGINGNERVERYFTEEDKKVLNNYWDYRLQVFKELLIDIDWEEHLQAHVQKDELFHNTDKIY